MSPFFDLHRYQDLMRPTIATPLLLVCLALGLTGCGGSDEDLPATVAVSGQVTLDGQPLTEGTVMFHPQGGKGHPATGEISASGIYTLSTFDAEDGAVVGNHVVTVQVFPKGANPGFEDQAPGYFPIPKKYTSPDTSDLLVSVNDGANNIPIELESE